MHPLQPGEGGEEEEEEAGGGGGERGGGGLRRGIGSRGRDGEKRKIRLRSKELVQLVTPNWTNEETLGSEKDWTNQGRGNGEKTRTFAKFPTLFDIFSRTLKGYYQLCSDCIRTVKEKFCLCSFIFSIVFRRDLGRNFISSRATS